MPNQSGLGQVGRVFQALADPTRRAIVERLVRAPATVKALAEPLAMSLPAVMQHLQVLESAGVIVTEKVGRVRSCRINQRRCAKPNSGSTVNAHSGNDNSTSSATT